VGFLSGKVIRKLSLPRKPYLSYRDYPVATAGNPGISDFHNAEVG
jgi:hypothetical protein